jgi:hypothetical protein
LNPVAEVEGEAWTMDDRSPLPMFTGAELALADTVILLMKVMSMHGIIDNAAITTVFTDLENRYREQHFQSAAAMAEYLRTHTTDSDQETTLVRAHNLRDDLPEGSA